VEARSEKIAIAFDALLEGKEPSFAFLN